jgi:hypothetical protein
MMKKNAPEVLFQTPIHMKAKNSILFLQINKKTNFVNSNNKMYHHHQGISMLFVVNG